MSRQRHGGTSTSNFGTGARESHDASAFYARFQPKQISADDTLAEPFELARPLVCGDSRATGLPDSCVALVVTSPPYFAGKEYEEALGQGVVPATYIEYLQMLSDVFQECLRVLEPGGRMAVNVANLGRRPYRSLAADVIRILDDDLGMLLRGEVIWKKADGAAGSCAWGSYRSPTNPVLRDVSERVVIASKGRFDRAVEVKDRRARGLPCESSISTDEFLDATRDVWSIRPESARRVQHPAPFPVELPQRLIELYTFKDDLVLDPFLGSGTTAVAAVRTGRRYVGYETDPAYVALAERRVVEARKAVRARESGPARLPLLASPLLASPLAASPLAASPLAASPLAASRVRDRDAASPTPEMGDGKAAKAYAADVVEQSGFTIVERDRKLSGLGVAVSLVAHDAAGGEWFFDVTGAFTSTRDGLSKQDTLWRCLGRASVLAACKVQPLVLLSSDLPRARTAGDRALRAVGARALHDVADLVMEADRERLAQYAKGGHCSRPLPGFWSCAELDLGWSAPAR